MSDALTGYSTGGAQFTHLYDGTAATPLIGCGIPTMKPREDLTDIGPHDRLRCWQPEPPRGTGHEEQLADHHREELLAALNAVAALRASRGGSDKQL